MKAFSPKSILSGFFTSVICFLITCFVFTQQVAAQDFQFVPDVKTKTFYARENTSYQFYGNHNDLSVEVVKWSEMIQTPGSWQDKYTFPVINNIIKVGIDHQAGLVDNTPYKYKILLRVKGYSDPANPSSFVQFDIPEFVIENNNDSLVTYQDRHTRRLEQKFYKMEIQIKGIYKYDLNNPANPPQDMVSFSNPALIKKFYIESSIMVQRYDKLPGMNLVVNASPDNTTNELQVSWAYMASSSISCDFMPVQSTSVSPVKYELEWTYVDDYKFNFNNWTSGYKNTAGNFSVPYNFRNNATRIQTYKNSFKIPIIYEHGTIVYRVRAIRPDPNNLSKLIYSGWSLIGEKGTLTNSSFPVYQIGVATINCRSQCLYFIDAFEQDKFDWQYSINFAEEGKYKHVLNYFDGAGRNRQTQTKINTDNQYIIAADHIYDYEGRPSIQTLPVPVISPNLRYKNNLSYKAGSNPLSPYTAADFDNGCTTSSLPAFAGVSLAGTYYSAANPDKAGMQQFVPDAGGYPFIQTIYSPDNTNKVLIQGGVGANYQANTGHVTSNTYVRADQKELNQLFGTQAGRSEYYPKVITRDPNGQMSYSIFNQSGKVVATALMGTAPGSNTPILALDGLPAPASATTDVLANLTQSVGDNMRSANYAFFPDAGGNTNTLTYSAKILPYYTGCTGEDNFINVKGQYKVKIVDECGNPVPGTQSGQDIGQSNFANGTVLNPPAAQVTPGSGITGGNFTLNPSKYTLIKELYFPDTAIVRLADSFTNSHSGIGKCYNYEDNFIRKSVLDAKVPCKKSDEPVTHCELLKRKMMDELYPGAKYGKYEKTEDGKFLSGPTDPLYAPNSIFTMTNDIGEIFNPNTAYPGGGTPGSQSSPCSYTKQCSYENGGGAVNNNGNQLYNNIEVIPCVSDYVPNPAPGDIYISGNMYCQNSAVTCTDYKYRYQWCLTLPNINPNIPGPNGTMSVAQPAGNFSPDIFIANFNDDIAEALLPFHPEYCKLLYCEDNYPDFLSGIKTYKEAQILGAATLTAIIHNDPLFNNNINSGTNTQGPFSELELTKFEAPSNPTAASNFNASPFARPLYQQALEQAYCGSENPEALAYCRNVTYHNRINTFNGALSTTQIADEQLADAYIRNLISLYISNRTIRMQKKMESLNNCGNICQQDFRIQLVIAPAAMPDVFVGNTSGLSQIPGIPSDFITQFNNGLNNSNVTTPPAGFSNMDTENQRADCEAEVMSFYNALKYWAGAQNQAALESGLRSLTGCVSINSTPPFNKLTPQNVKNLLQNLSSNMNEYWNPYLAAYNVFDAMQSKPGSEFVSKHPAFYTDLETFLNSAAIENALSGANSGTPNTFTLDPDNNKFESALAATLGGNNIVARAYTRSVTDDYTLSKYNNVNTRNYIVLVLTNQNNSALFDTLYLSKRISAPSGSDVAIAGVAPSGFLVSDVQSVLNDPAYIGAVGGIVRDNMVFAKVNGTAAGSPATDNYVIWSYKTPMLSPKDPESIDSSLNCVLIRKAVEDYNTDAPTWGLPTFTDHPSYKICLANYLNYKLGKKHTYTEYEKLMKGCALNMVPIAFKKAPGQFYFSNLDEVGATQLISNINHLNDNAIVNNAAAPVTNIDYFSYKDGSNTVKLWLDLNSIPYDKRVNTYNYIANNYPAALNNGFDPDVYTEVLVPQGAFTPDWNPVIANNIGYPFTISEETIYTKNASGSYSIPYVKYILNGVVATGASENVVPVTIAEIKYHLSQQYNDQEVKPVFLDSRVVMYSDVFWHDPAESNKRNYLTYAYSGLPASYQQPIDIANSLSPQVVKANTSSFTNSDLMSYNNPWCRGSKSDLYYAQSPTNADAGWYRLTKILENVKTALTGNKLFPTANATDAGITGLATNGPLPGMLSLKIFKMADGRAWYRFFDDYNKLHNVYLVPAGNMLSGGWQNGQPPAGNGQSGYAADLSTLKAVPGAGDSMYVFKVDMLRQFGSQTHRVTCYGYTDFALAPSGTIKDVVLSAGEPQCIDTLPCERVVILAAIQQGKALYRQYMDSIKESHILAMREWFPAKTTDALKLTIQKQQYQYTLYNYDLAGNLTSTVPPMGVVPFTEIINPATGTSNVDEARNSANAGVNISSSYYPIDTKKSEYWYNSKNQLTRQKTPDGGETKFYYDKSGKLAFSQNAKQLPQSKFSYTLYDNQDRIKETGQIYLSATTVATNAQSRTSAELANIITGKPREDVVATFYDEALLVLGSYTGEGLNNQENLRKRVSSILYVPQLGASNPAASHFSYGTHFSYDALGNVKTLVQDNPYMDYLGQRFKRVDYDYDLLSGKVNMVSYNRGKADQFYQRYKYDADNRITAAESSNDGLAWDHDAGYTYYKHGPLAQVSIGDLHVQSVQYAYTIQGWLKAINGDVLDSIADMGQDGKPDPLAANPFPMFPNDVVAHALDYHPGDYIPIGDRQVLAAANANTNANTGNTAMTDPLTKGLYNGNIARQTTAISRLDNLQRTYTYDQLNRIKSTRYNNVSNLTKAVTEMADAFANTYQYDRDGNIMKLTRNDANGTPIDNLEYKYQQGNNVNANNEAKNNNMLQYVGDISNNTQGLPGSQAPGNYGYDPIGNLIKDMQGNIQDIKWNAYGKVTDIQIGGGNKRIHYDYDAMGNRVRKDVLTQNGQDYTRVSDVYVRDASGNILAVYKGKSTIDDTYTIDWVNLQINNFHGGFLTDEGYGLAPFLVQQFGNNGEFTNPLLEQAELQAPQWASEQVASLSLGQYFQASEQFFGQAVRDNLSKYIDDARNWNEGAFLAKALQKNKRESFIPILHELLRTGLSPKKAVIYPKGGNNSVEGENEHNKSPEEKEVNNEVAVAVDDEVGPESEPQETPPASSAAGAEDPQTKMISHLVNGEAALLAMKMAEAMNIPWYGKPDADVREFSNYIEKYGPGAILDIYSYVSEGDNEDIRKADAAFIGGVALDPVIITSRWLEQNTDGAAKLGNAIVHTPETDDAVAFMENWLDSNDPEWLKKNTSLQDRLNVVMGSNPLSFMVDYLNNVGIASVNASIRRIPQLSLSNYLDRVWNGVNGGTLNPSYDPPDVVTTLKTCWPTGSTWRNTICTAAAGWASKLMLKENTAFATSLRRAAPLPVPFPKIPLAHLLPGTAAVLLPGS